MNRRHFIKGLVRVGEAGLVVAAAPTVFLPPHGGWFSKTVPVTLFSPDGLAKRTLAIVNREGRIVVDSEDFEELAPSSSYISVYVEQPGNVIENWRILNPNYS